MKNPTIGLILAALVVMAMACSITIRIPEDRLVTEPPVRETIEIPLPQADQAEVILSFGAGELTLAGGAQGYLVQGEALYNVPDFKPRIEVKDNRVFLESGNLEISGFPRVKGELRNEWNLRLGDMPLVLSIEAGAYQGDLDLSGVPLVELNIEDGASNVTLRFDQVNPQTLQTMRYSTGASNLRLVGLGNANFKRFIFRGGLGNYTLDFSGASLLESQADIQAGACRMVIVVPEERAVRVVVNSGLTQIETNGAWKINGSEYIHEGAGPILTISIEMGAGSLQLRAE